jgi:hypothetical protein
MSGGVQVTDGIRRSGQDPRLKRHLNSTRLRRWMAPTWLLLVAIALVGLHVHTYTKVGPIDELQHIDYLYKSPAIVAMGDRVGQDAMRQEACRGIDAPFVPPPCSSTAHYDPNSFQVRGYNTAAINTPLYYTLTKAVAVPLESIGGIDDLVTAGRLVGGLWLGLGLVLAYAAGRRLAIARLPLTATLTALACSSTILYRAATITPDAMDVAVGAGVFLTFLYWEHAPTRRWPLLVLVSTIVLLIKMTNVIVLFAMGIYMMIRIVRALYTRLKARPGKDSRLSQAIAPWLLGGIVLSVTTAVVLGTTLWIQNSLSHDASLIPMNAQYTVKAFPAQHFIEQFGVFLNPPTLPATHAVGSPLIQTLVDRTISTFFLAGIVGAGLFGAANAKARPYAQALLLTAVIGAPMFVAVSYLSQSMYVPPPVRYANTLLPAVAVITAGLVKTRGAQWLVALGSAGLLAATVLRLL